MLLLLVAGAARSDAIDQALALSTVTARLEEWPEVTVAARAWAERRIDAETSARLNREVAAAFSQRLLLERLSARLREAADLERLEGFVAWYGTPVGRRVTSPEPLPIGPELLRRYPSLATRRPGELQRQRWEAFQRIDLRSGATRDVMQIALAIGLSTARNAHALACGTGTKWASAEGKLLGRIEAVRPLVASRVLETLDLLHAELSYADVLALASFTRSRDAEWFYATVGRELERTLRTASDAVGQAMAAEVAVRCARPASGG
ncbi:MAG: hypothetical protein QNK04_28895 [Myxococcota bacterium]|nr:hypothetical protein [Myxococcota bacterium]